MWKRILKVLLPTDWVVAGVAMTSLVLMSAALLVDAAARGELPAWALRALAAGALATFAGLMLWGVAMQARRWWSKLRRRSSPVRRELQAPPPRSVLHGELITPPDAARE
jgi:hypothetical protein